METDRNISARLKAFKPFFVGFIKILPFQGITYRWLTFHRAWLVSISTGSMTTCRTMSLAEPLPDAMLYKAFSLHLISECPHKRKI
jgi:hypothetical protein